MTEPSMFDVHQDRPLGPDRKRRRKRFRLSKLGVNFVSLVPAGDNPPARVVLMKAYDPELDQGTDRGDLDMHKITTEESMPDEKADPMVDADPRVIAYVKNLEDAVLAAEAERDAALAQAAGASGGDDGDTGLSEDSIDKILKGADPGVAAVFKVQQEEIRKARERAAQAEALAKAEHAARERMLLKSRVQAQMAYLGDPEALTELLAKTRSNIPAEDYDALEGLLVAASRGLETSAMFSEVGKSGDTDGGVNRLERKAQEIRKANPELSYDQAIDQAMAADPSAYLEALGGAR